MTKTPNTTTPAALAVAKYIERLGRTVVVTDNAALNAWRGVMLCVDDRYQIKVVHDPIRDWSEEYPFHRVMIEECRTWDRMLNDKRPGAYYRVNASMSHAIQIKHETFEWWTKLPVTGGEVYACPRELGTIVELRTGEQCRMAKLSPTPRTEPERDAQLSLFETRKLMRG